jgi:predicted component of type VI protein secretion system
MDLTNMVNRKNTPDTARVLDLREKCRSALRAGLDSFSPALLVSSHNIRDLFFPSSVPRDDPIAG